ncbi:hypothetical protein Poli38472_001928 [Pythium oligandrum]|uniref:N-acetyltransferase domain-containing protein n=1 Tax=Pythium oligandrum TaxID=41045 RepID=A0A8K1CTR2_PYTOL|nr:hypothetical protein Poli38472_001928 [Pythium oligandrum]|eukprot:TMW69772.1 hypothetical protein Poli38472_001928 [Pythium oligandrum]
MGPLVHVRPLQADDIPALALNEQLTDFCTRALERRDWTTKSIRVFVTEVPAFSATETSQLAGFTLVGLGYPPYFPALDESVGQMYIASIEIREAFRRRGYATAVLEFFKQEAQTLGLDVLRCECEKGWRVTLYECVGFVPVEYKGTSPEYPESHQMLELWFTKNNE